MKFRVTLSLILIGLLFLSPVLADQIDINNASLTEMEQLPLSFDQARAVYEYVQFHGPLESVYELSNVRELSNQDLQSLKKAVILKPDESASTNTRLEDQYRKVENWTSTDG